MAIKPSKLKQALKEGRFKNSLETGKGTYKTIGEERLVRKREFFGLPESMAPEIIPKYGFVSSKKQMDWDKIMEFDYGDIYVKFRPSIRQRTTVTLGDSFNANSGMRVATPTPINAPKIDVLNTKVVGTKVSPDRLKGALQSRSYSSLGKATGAEYVEAQIYGKLETTAIESVEFASKKQMQAFARSVKRTGLDIAVKPSSQHERLYRISRGFYDEMRGFSAADLDRLGRPYIDEIWKDWSPQILGTTDPRRSITRPQHIADWATKNAGKLTLEKKREGLKLFFEDIAKKESSGYPKQIWSYYRKSQAGFTDDVANEALLKEYPGA